VGDKKCEKGKKRIIRISQLFPINNPLFITASKAKVAPQNKAFLGNYN